jgi:hemoglobin/transferrin/lactoferrin receptor protein
VTKYWLTLILTGFVWTALAADEAEPDQAAPDEPKGLARQFETDTIVVSATRTERAQFTTPAAVSTIRRGDIETVQPYGFQDLFETIAGVSVQGGPRRIAEEPSIRGFADEQVVIRLDGTRQNFNKAHGGRFLLDPDLISSIEVLRGASSAVYGSGALGGVFVIETVNGRELMADRDGFGGRTKGAFQTNGEEWAGFGSFYGQAGDFDLVGSLIYRDVGEDLRDGRGRDIFASRDEISNALIKLGFEPTPDQRLELIFDDFENSGRNPPNANSPAGPTDLVDRSTDRTNLRARYRHHPSGNRWLNLDASVYRNEVDTEEFRLTDGRIDLSDFSTTGFELTNSSLAGRIADQALRLSYGVEWLQDSQSGTRNGLDRLQFPDAEVDYRAAYVQAEIPLPGGFNLIPGLRYDEFDYQANSAFDPRKDDQVSPRIAVGWQPAGPVYLWAEYAEAFRAPSLTELFADGVHFVVPLGPGQVVINEFLPTPGLRPERSEQVQIGARWRSDNWLNSAFDLQLEALWHRSEVEDFVEQVVVFVSGEPSFDPVTQTLVFPGITTNFNSDAELTGFEFDARLNHARGYFQASVATLDSERARDGTALAGVQPDRVGLSAGIYALDQQLTVGAELVLAKDRRDVPDAALQTPGFGKTDLFVNYLPVRGPLAGFEFRLAIDNLFDKDFRIHPNAIDQPGRSVRLSLAKNFQWLN